MRIALAAGARLPIYPRAPLLKASRYQASEPETAIATMHGPARSDPIHRKAEQSRRSRSAAEREYSTKTNGEFNRVASSSPPIGARREERRFLLASVQRFFAARGGGGGDRNGGEPLRFFGSEPRANKSEKRRKNDDVETGGEGSLPLRWERRSRTSASIFLLCFHFFLHSSLFNLYSARTAFLTPPLNALGSHSRSLRLSSFVSSYSRSRRH